MTMTMWLAPIPEKRLLLGCYVVNVGVFHVPLPIHAPCTGTICKHNTSLMSRISRDFCEKEVQVFVSSFNNLEKERGTVQQEAADTNLFVPESCNVRHISKVLSIAFFWLS